ncbi:MAG TPA: DUF5668 domain-containing protein [Candidatus Acidoferrales bacterium]
MNCAVHADAASTGFCSQCGKAMCSECARDVRGVLFCEECLAARVTAPPAPPPGTPNAGVALMLGFIPGVGAIYNGEYLKGLVHIAVFFGLISLADRTHGAFGPMFGMLVAAFYIYMIVDAYRTAKLRTTGQAAATSGWAFPGTSPGSSAPVGPIILIVVGVLFLADNMGLFDFGYFDYVWNFWPVILIAIGAWMLWRRTAGPQPPAGGSGSPQ